MERMWMVRGDGGSLFDAFRERGVVAVGWNQLAAHAKQGGAHQNQYKQMARSAGRLFWCLQGIRRQSDHHDFRIDIE